jgi:hypothetical protein
MRGRVLALLSVVFLGSTPIGSPIIGAVSELAGPRVAITLGGLATGVAVAWTVRQMRRLEAAQPADRVEPVPEIEAQATAAA